MKLKDGFILREVAGNYVVVAVGKRTKEFNGVINLSESAADIWKLLKENTTEDEIIQKMQEMYDAEKEVLSQGVKTFVGKLREAGLIEE